MFEGHHDRGWTMATLKESVEERRRHMEADPSTARAALSVACELGDRYQAEVNVGRHTISVDEPRSLGGDGTAPAPVGYAMAALASCEALSFRTWSEVLDIPFDSLRVVVSGDIDMAGVFGVGGATTTGFGRLDVEVSITGGESGDRYEELCRAVGAHSPVLELVRGTTPVSRTIDAG